MASIRQEKVSRIIKEAVSDVFIRDLSDPRIKGFISVTRVEMSPDLKNAEVYLSILADNDQERKLSFDAIVHAGRHIRKETGDRVSLRYCPRLNFHLDDKVKKTIETLEIIEEVSGELESDDSDDARP